jgi:hypothetical protein
MSEPNLVRAFEVKPGQAFDLGGRFYIRLWFDLSEDQDGVGFYCWDIIDHCMDWVYEPREFVRILHDVEQFDPQRIWQRREDFHRPQVDTSRMPDFSDPKGFAGYEFMGGDD